MVTAEYQGTSELVLRQQPFRYLEQTDVPDERWQIPIQIRMGIGNKTEHRRLVLTDRETTMSLPEGITYLLVNEGGHGFYRVRHGFVLIQQLLNAGVDNLAPIERFNLISDAWATTVAGLTPLADYLRLASHFKLERDKNVWARYARFFLIFKPHCDR